MIAGIANWLSLFYKQRPWLRPAFKAADWQTGRSLLRLGTLFFILQIAVSLAFTSDNVIVAQVVGPQAVTDLSVPARLFSLIPLFLGIALTPLWPAYGEAMARGDKTWVILTLRRSFLATLAIGALGALALIVSGKILIRM